MKILMLSWEYPPNMVGGLGQHVFDLSRYLVQYGQEVHIITPRAKNAPDQENIHGVHIHRAGRTKDAAINFKAWTFYFNGDAIREATNIMKGSSCFDIIHAHDWLVAYAGRALSRIYRIPLVTTIHATEHGRNLGLHNRMQYEINEVEKNMALEARKVICCSHYMHQEINSLFGIDPDMMTIIPNGVDIEQFKRMPSRPSIQVPEGSRPIIFLGRLVPEKGTVQLLNAFVEVKKQIPDARLYIGGTGPQKEYLQERSLLLGLDQDVVFTGFIMAKDRNYLYERAELAVFPSLYEPFGIVALEAMATGTPVIVGDTGGLSEIVQHGCTGLKVPPGDEQALADAMVEILSDNNRAENLVKNALHRVEEYYCWDAIAKHTIDVYQQATGSAWTAKGIRTVSSGV